MIKSNIFELKKATNRIIRIIEKLQKDDLSPFDEYSKIVNELCELNNYVNNFNLVIDIDMEIHSCLKTRQVPHI